MKRLQFSHKRRLFHSLRAWHSPTADLQLCWRFMENIETQTKKCATVRRWTQFDYTISRFAVPRERRLQVAAPTLYPTVTLNQSRTIFISITSLEA